jgi:hypothetical protein
MAYIKHILPTEGLNARKFNKRFVHSFIHSFSKGEREIKRKKLVWEKSGIGIERREGKEEKDWLGKVEGRRRKGGKEVKKEGKRTIVPGVILCQVPEIIDPVFAKTSPKRSFCMTENERFGLVFKKTGSINSGKGVFSNYCIGLVFTKTGSINSGKVCLVITVSLSLEWSAENRS